MANLIRSSLFLSSVTFLCFTVQLSAQTYTMQNGSDTACSGIFYDSGGDVGDYGNNENLVYTICPDNSGSIEVDFSSFDVEGGFDELCIYDGTSTGAPQLGCFSNNNSVGGNTISASNSNGSGCLTFEFTSDGSVTLDGWEAQVSCSFPCQAVDPEIDSTSPPEDPSSGHIDICPGTPVTFWGDALYPNNDSLYHQDDSTSLFIWDWGNGTKDTGQTVTKNFNNAGIFTVTLTVIDSNGCGTSTQASRTVLVSPKPNFDGTGPVLDSICLGGTNTLIGVVDPDTIQENCSPPVADTTALPDGSGVSYSSSVTVDCYNPGQTLNNISNLQNLCLTMEHSYIGDLQITITCPSGQTVTLADAFNGSGGWEFLGEPVDGNTGTPGVGYQYCFNPSPTYGTWNAEVGNYQYTYTDVNGNTYTNQDYLPAGSYQSEEPLSNLVGCQLNGDWTITVTDNLGIDDGYIFNWGLDFDNSILPPNLSEEIPIDSSYWNSDPTVVSTSANEDTATVQPDSTGQQCYVYTAVDSFGCTWDTTVCFYVNELNMTVSNDTTICQGGSATLTANASGGAAPYTYHWGGLGNSSSHTVSPGSDTTYQVYAEDASGCLSDTLDIQVSYHPPLQADASMPGPQLCPGDTVRLTATASGGIGPPYSYSWSNGSNGDTVNVIPDSTQEYVLTVEDSCETPTSSDTVTVTVNPLPDPQIGGANLNGCTPITAALTNASTGVVPGSDCSWDFGDGSTGTGCDTVLHQYDTPGCYDVQLTVETPAGCVDSATSTDHVCVHPYPNAAFDFRPEETTYLDPGISFTNQSSGATDYFWDFAGLDSSSATHPSYTFPDDGPGTYEVCLTATSSEGCKDTVCSEVVIKDKFFLYVPNAFTPDGDGVNDIFRPVIKGEDPSEYRFAIYDRWGKEIFSTKDPEEGWDGSVNGDQKAGKLDVYVWKLVTKNRHTGKGITKQGHVTLIR